jgi:hypothetical protein
MSIDQTKLREAVEVAMDDLVGRIREEAEARGKVASGKTLASLRTSVLGSSAFVVGTLTGGEQWKFVGNGRGPGRMPPIQNIEQWIASKGLNLSAWAVGRKIAKEGSRDFRLGRTNIFADAIGAWQQGGAFEAVGTAGREAFGDAYVREVTNIFKATA